MKITLLVLSSLTCFAAGSPAFERTAVFGIRGGGRRGPVDALVHAVEDEVNTMFPAEKNEDNHEKVSETKEVSVPKKKVVLNLDAHAIPHDAMVEVFDKVEKAAMHAVEDEVDVLFHQ